MTSARMLFLAWLGVATTLAAAHSTDSGILTSVLGIREAGIGKSAVPELVAMDPYSFKTKVLFKDTGSDFVNTVCTTA